MQSIFEAINYESSEDSDSCNHLEISLFKEAFQSLERRNIIINGGSESRDSFFISVEEISQSVSAILLPNIANEMPKETFDADTFINNRFDNIITERIKLYVREELKSLLASETMFKPSGEVSAN